MRNLQRISYYDFLKGLVIMGVVAIHTIIFNEKPYSLSGISLALFRNILGCCVPFFVFISGYFLYSKEVSTKHAYKEFIANRFRVIYMPMLVWALPWLGLALLNTHSFLGLGYTILKYLLGGMYVLYFFTLILECYILLPKIQNISKRGVFILSIISIVVTSFWSLINYTTDIHPPLILYCSFPTYIGFFALGCYLGRTKTSIKMWPTILIIVTGLILSMLESFFWLGYNPENNWLGLKSSNHVLSFGIILLLLSPKLRSTYVSNKLKSLIEWFGRQSMPIYASHLIVMFLYGGSIIGFSPDNWIENWVVIFISDIIFIYIISKIFPKKILPYLGIR